MVEKVICYSRKEFNQCYRDSIINSAQEVYDRVRQPVRILDLATGPNNINPEVVKAMVSRGIDFSLVLSDISPSLFETGYGFVVENVSKSGLASVVCVLADANDLSTDIRKVPVYEKDGTRKIKPIEQVLEEFQFLSKGYKNSKRIVKFDDSSFDIVTGCLPYTSLQDVTGNKGGYESALSESARVLREDGYHIVEECHVEELNKEAERTQAAMRSACKRPLDKIRKSLDSLMHAKAVFSIMYTYEFDDTEPDEALQNGDLIEDCVLVHQN